MVLKASAETAILEAAHDASLVFWAVSIAVSTVTDMVYGLNSRPILGDDSSRPPMEHHEALSSARRVTILGISVIRRDIIVAS